MTASLATYSQFFRLGLETGICTADAAREWALSVIAEMDEPPGEVIEVSWRKPLPQVITDLNSVPGDANLEIAGSWLLGILLRCMSFSKANPHSVLTGAKQIALSMSGHIRDTELYSRFSTLEDELNLAESGVFGTVDGCKAEILEVLGRHSLPPPAALLNFCQ
jgi:hypothetical protein